MVFVAPGVIAVRHVVVLGLVSLALVRPVAVTRGTIAAHLPWPTVVFLVWFGPRRIASVNLAAIVVKGAGLPETTSP